MFLHLNHEFRDLIRASARSDPEQGNPFVWDLEYMRAQDPDNPKAFELKPEVRRQAAGAPDTRPEARHVAPDLLWHRRNLTGREWSDVKYPEHDGDKLTVSATNLIAIEVKLRASAQDLRTDWAKLALLTGAADEIEWYKDEIRLGRDAALDRVPGNHKGALILPRQVLPYRLGLSLNLFPKRADIHAFTHDMRQSGGQAPHPFSQPWIHEADHTQVAGEPCRLSMIPLGREM